MEVYDCLDENLDVWGHHFLEASAGTGKTFTIEHVTVRLLLDPKAIDIDQILIVTFTRAATRELKIRLQKRLRECLQALVEGEVKYPYLDYSPQDRAFAIQRLELALSCFDKAQIYTIHAFCHRMLVEGGFESGSSLSQSGPDDQNY
ncbi:MAG: UvrD-helicase domain-containing protein, partial [Chlamydiia bacterium]|nr:UvrD-helicase domain-containing protein [Chlamydiia bacterium]